ncbi:hypothetical protein AVEN_154715-1 [Araneus ventricosus]|uniref:Uncharacterized protein n=1 Tax=Araneus ventricosus TaxID=182803 RepID=A0A4Y2UXB2_ARAVE|nr:hypothetical protein AVEN_154715-1 [Araneus ventricosus]
MTKFTSSVCARNASPVKSQIFSKPVDTNMCVCKERIVCKSRQFSNRSTKIGVCASSLRGSQLQKCPAFDQMFLFDQFRTPLIGTLQREFPERTPSPDMQEK